MDLPLSARFLTMEDSMDGTQASASGVSALPSDVSDVDECVAMPVVTVMGHVEPAAAVAAPVRKRKGKQKMVPVTEEKPVHGKTRPCKKTGAIVPKSSIGYHLFKISKKALRKQKLWSAQHLDDEPVFVPNHALDFVQVRHHVGATVADILLNSKVLDAEGHDMVRFEIESAHEALLQDPKAYASSRFGSVVSWVLLLTQQVKVLQNEGEWMVDTTEEVEEWSINTLFRPMQAGTTLRLAPFPTSMSDSAATLSSLLQRSFGSASNAKFIAALRKRAPGSDWIHSEIAAGNPPGKRLQLLGK